MNIISYSLWGNNPKYTVGAIRNAELAAKIYPGWISAFYVHDNVAAETINTLIHIKNTIVFLKHETPDWTGMFWRFRAGCLLDKGDVCIFRDTDSRLNMREKYAVDEWLSSDKTFHIMRDHPYHNFPILGGMWGMKYKEGFEFKSIMDQFTPTNEYGTDYKFFAQKLYPLIGSDCIIHDPFFNKFPFPTERENYEFVGDVFDENDQRHPEYWKVIKQFEQI